MINRVSDYNILPNEEFEKLAKAVDKKEKKQLFDVVTEDKLPLIKKELKLQGYDVQVEAFDNKYKVYAIMPDKLDYREAIQSGSFKKLAWGRYCFQRTQEAALGMFKYDFDDGSIWRVMVGEDGKEYLIKEVDDEQDENVVRVKQASLNIEKIAVNDNNVKNVLAIVYDNIDTSQGSMTYSIINDILGSEIKQDFYNILNKKLASLIDNTIQKNQFIKSADYISDVNSIVKVAIDNQQVNSKNGLEKLIVEYSNQIISKTGQMNKLFD